ncbi:MAG: 2-oxo acid dehydrogenase subunit E2 [Calditrichaeota bacterium]|nr:MAG: 2-oxo acid dehydrogenase subunit E2 [Calditrichota bacterium]
MPEIVPIVLPEEEQEGTVSVVERWLKKPGDWVKQHEPILEINTDKVSMEIAAPASGRLVRILKEENEEVKPGDVLGEIELVAEESGEQPAAEASSAAPEAQARPAARTAPLSPAVRRLLKQHNLDPSQITGTGQGGRITVEDVENFLRRQQAGAAAEEGIPSRKVPHSQMRKQIARHMVESMLKTAPHVTAVWEADMAAVMAHREKHREAFQRQGVRLTYTAYFVQAAVRALQAVPEVNSRWHEDYLEIFEDYNIGIAVALDDGLIVPVLHRAQELDLLETARRLQDLTERAREGRLRPHEVKNGTFSITNHGMTGSLIATPIINQPQSAILGIGKLEKRMVVVEKDGQEAPEIRPRLYVTLTIDHRVLDGFKANQFLGAFVDALQQWK